MVLKDDFSGLFTQNPVDYSIKNRDLINTTPPETLTTTYFIDDLYQDAKSLISYFVYGFRINSTHQEEGQVLTIELKTSLEINIIDEEKEITRDLLYQWFLYGIGLCRSVFYKHAGISFISSYDIPPPEEGYILGEIEVYLQSYHRTV